MSKSFNVSETCLTNNTLKALHRRLFTIQRCAHCKGSWLSQPLP
ncbi:zf-TFIIB domain-containing protein [[Leptolyngbya] sp. PCC 7376]